MLKCSKLGIDAPLAKNHFCLTSWPLLVATGGLTAVPRAAVTVEDGGCLVLPLLVVAEETFLSTLAFLLLAVEEADVGAAGAGPPVRLLERLDSVVGTASPLLPFEAMEGGEEGMVVLGVEDPVELS